MMIGLCALFIFAVSLHSSTAIFEDQVGKFDWRQQYVGCVNELRVEHAKATKSDLIFVTTQAQLLAAIKSNTGDIAWRQLHEDNSTSPLLFTIRNNMVISLGKNGEMVRGWEREKGAMVWQTQIHTTPVKSKSLIATSEGSVFVLDQATLTAISLHNGHIKWSFKLDSNKDWLGVVQGSQSVTVIGGVKDQQVDILRFDSPSPKTQSIPAKWFNQHRCIVSSGVLVCYDSSSIHVIDMSSDPAAVQSSSIDNISGVLALNVDGYVALRSAATLHLFSIAPSLPPKLLFSVQSTDAVSSVRSADGRDLLGVLSSAFELSVYDLATGKRVLNSRLPHKAAAAPIKQLSFVLTAREWQLVTIGHDCRMDLFVASVVDTNPAELLLEWTRHEALSAISSMHMIDLPLSEAQAGIEWEFISQGGVLESLTRRLYSQASQLHKAMVKAAKRILSAPSLMSMRSKSFGDWMSSLRLSASHRDVVVKDNSALERDYFNLRKLVLVATTKSTLYGMDSNDGSILWRLYVGKELEPLVNSVGVETVPLFLQRSTAHYHYSALAAVALQNKYTRNGVLVQFDPISGKLIERVDLPFRIKTINMLAVLDDQDVHPLLIVDSDHKVRTYPSKTGLQAESTNRMHILDVDKHGRLQGYRVNTNTMHLEQVWGVDLHLSPHQSILTLSTKPNYQRVHSAGKVLGDRSVLYKYSNPNLVVIPVLDSLHNTLYMHLVDAVNGYIVHTAKQTKVSGAVHVVQCENWVTYSYWNEKSRRMELAVIELFEGEQQTDQYSFNSFTPAIPPQLRVLSQAYIFPQGVSALGVTETEQGLSTRSLLVAMPLGGVYGISKRIIDARRPLEMTAELAEEMLIPYRPELPIASEDFVNYNQSVFNIKHIKTTASGLESTSLMLAYGLDLFFARITPSGTFDILKDDFDHLLISVVLVGLVLGSLLCKRISRNHSLKQAWQ